MSVFGEELNRKLEEILNKLGEKALQEDFLEFQNTVAQSNVLMNNSNIELYQYVDSNLSETINAINIKISNDISDAITPVTSDIGDINTALITVNSNINLKLNISDYDTSLDDQNGFIENRYLSKGEFEVYKINEGLKDILQGITNGIVGTVVGEVNDIKNVLGVAILSTGITLANEVVNTVDDAFLNVDGRLVNNSNNIVLNSNNIAINFDNISTINSALITVNSNIDLKFNISDYDLGVIQLNSNIDKKMDSVDVDFKLTFKTANSDFIILRDDVSSSNVRYDSEILQLSSNQSTPGPQGEVGPIGPQGEVGPSGSNGSQGPIGPSGSNGSQGPIGAQGPIGPSGSNGSQGPIGAQGPIGPSGSNGSQGPIGAQGPIGPSGSNGSQGPIGPSGSNGAQGPIGPSGSNGSQGPIGPSGSNGSQGPIGPQGPTGPTGPSGSGNGSNIDDKLDITDFNTACNLIYTEIDKKANTNNVFLRWQTYDRAAINERIDIKLNITDFEASCNLINTTLNSKANNSDVYNKDNTYNKTGIDSRLALKVDITNYDIDINQINSNVTTTSNIAISGVVLSTINATGLVAAGALISANVVSISGINAILPTKLAITEFNQYKNTADINFDNRYTKSQTDSLLTLKVDLTTFNSNNSNINNSITLKENITDNNTKLNLKTNQTDFTILNSDVNSSNIRYDSNIIVINSNINLKTNQTDFTTLNNNVNSSNIRYDSNIINVASNLLLKTNQTDFIILRDDVNSSNIRYDSNITVINSNINLKTNNTDFIILRDDVNSSNIRYDSNIALKVNVNDYNLNNILINSNISLKTNLNDFNTSNLLINTSLVNLNIKSLATDVYALALNDKVNLKENITDNNGKLSLKANLSGADFTGNVSTPNIQNIESQILEIANYTGVPIVSNLKINQADYSQKFDAFMENRNLDLYTLRLPFSQEIAYGSVVNLTAEPIINRIGSGWAEYRMLNEMDFSGRGNYLTYVGSNQDIYQTENVTDKSYLQFDDGRVETLLDDYNIEHSIFGSTGLNTGLVLSFDLKNLNATTSIESVFSIGDYLIPGSVSKNPRLITGVILENPKFTNASTLQSNYNSVYGWDTNVGWLVSSSGIESGSWPEHDAFDNTTSSAWISGGTTFPVWLQLKYPVPVILQSFKIASSTRTSGWATRMPKDWTMQGSNDNTNFTNVESFTRFNWEVQGREFTYVMTNKTTAYSHWRMNVTTGNGSDDIVIDELDLYTSFEPIPIVTCEGINITVNTTNIRLRMSYLGKFERNFNLENIDTTDWHHYDMVISELGDVKFYMDGILKTIIISGLEIETLRFFTLDNSTTNLLRIYPNSCLLSDLKLFLKPTIEETQIDDLTLTLLDRDAEYLLYDNLDSSGNGHHLDGTIIENGREFDGKQWFRRGQLISVIPYETPRITICSPSGGTGLTLSFDIKLFKTNTNQSSSVFGFGTQINTSYSTSSTQSAGSGLFLRIVNNDTCQLLICDANASFTFFVTSPQLSTTKWTNLVFQIQGSNSKVQIKLWTDGVSTNVSTNNVNTVLVIGTVTSTINRFIITGNYSDSPYLSNIKIWFSDTITSSEIVNGRLDAVDPAMSVSIVKQSQKYIDFRIKTNNSYLNFLNNYNTLLIRSSLISKQNVLLSSVVDLGKIGIEPIAWYKGNLISISDIIGQLESPTTSAEAVIFPNEIYLTSLKFQNFTINSEANVQIALRDIDRFDVKDYTFSYVYINDLVVPYQYDTILSIGFARVLDTPMPRDDLEFIRGLCFDFQNIPDTSDVNVDIGTYNMATGLDYLTIEDVEYVLGGISRIEFTISKTRLLTVYVNGKSASVQLTKPVNIVGKYNVKIHQRINTSGEEFANIKMWRSAVSSNRLAIEHLNYDKIYKKIPKYIPSVKQITLLYKNGIGLQNLAGNDLILRSGRSYFAIPYEFSPNGDNDLDGANLPITLPADVYSIGLYIRSNGSMDFGNIFTLGNPNEVLTIGESAFEVLSEKLLITSQFYGGSTLKIGVGGVLSFLEFFLMGITDFAEFLAKINSELAKRWGSNSPFNVSDRDGKIAFFKPSTVGIVVIYPDGAGSQLGINDPLEIKEADVEYFAQLPPTFTNESANQILTIKRYGSVGLTNEISFRYNGRTNEDIRVLFFKEGVPRMFLGDIELRYEKRDVVKTFIDYQFDDNLNDTSERGQTLVRSGTGTQDTLYTDGDGIKYMRVLAPYTVSRVIAPTTTHISIANKNLNGVGLRLQFKIKLTNTTTTNIPIFTLGKLPKVTDTGTTTWASGSGNTSRGIMFRIDNSRLSYVCIDANGNYTQYITSTNYSNNDGLLSTTEWVDVVININRVIGSNNKLVVTLVLDNILIDNTTADTTTSLDFSYEGGVNNNLIRFPGHANSHQITDLRMYLTDDNSARSVLDPLTFGGTMFMETNDSKFHLGVIDDNTYFRNFPEKLTGLSVVYSNEDLDKDDIIDL